jgi:hypothetical protein
MLVLIETQESLGHHPSLECTHINVIIWTMISIVKVVVIIAVVEVSS